MFINEMHLQWHICVEMYAIFFPFSELRNLLCARHPRQHFLVKKWAVNSRLNVLCAHFFTYYAGKSVLCLG